MSGLFVDRGKIIHLGPKLLPSLWPAIFFMVNTNNKIVHAKCSCRRLDIFTFRQNGQLKIQKKIHQQRRKGISQHDYSAKKIRHGTTKVGKVRDKQEEEAREAVPFKFIYLDRLFWSFALSNFWFLLHLPSYDEKSMFVVMYHSTKSVPNYKDVWLF